MRRAVTRDCDDYVSAGCGPGHWRICNLTLSTRSDASSGHAHLVTPLESPTSTLTSSHQSRRQMINAAIVGLGRWGQNLVNSVQGKSDAIRFVAGATRTVAKAEPYARDKGFPLYDSYEKVLADPQVDALVLATPHTQHARAGRRGCQGRQARVHGKAARAGSRQRADRRARLREGRCHARGGLQLALPAGAPGDQAHARGRAAGEAPAPRRQLLRAQRLSLLRRTTGARSGMKAPRAA